MKQFSAGPSGKNFGKVNNSLEIGNPTRAAVEQLLQTKAELTEAMEIKCATKRQWRLRETALGCSNRKLEVELKKLRAETDELDNAVLAKANETQKTHDHLQIYKFRNKQQTVDFRTYYQNETQNHSNLFTNAPIEYSSVCLYRDIEEYNRESDIVRAKIARVKDEMEDNITRYGLVEVGTNEEAKLLTDLDGIKKTLSNKEHIRRVTKAVEGTINALKLKVNQKEHDIAYLEKKLCKK